MTDTQTFKIELPSDSMEDKNKALGAIIRYARASILQTDIPGELKEFGDETPMSTIEIRELFGMSKANFSQHFIKFKDLMKNKYDKDITPIIKINGWGDIYTKWVVRNFLTYLNRDEIKYENIIL